MPPSAVPISPAPVGRPPPPRTTMRALASGIGAFLFVGGSLLYIVDRGGPSNVIWIWTALVVQALVVPSTTMAVASRSLRFWVWPEAKAGAAAIALGWLAMSIVAFASPLQSTFHESEGWSWSSGTLMWFFASLGAVCGAGVLVVLRWIVAPIVRRAKATKGAMRA